MIARLLLELQGAIGDTSEAYCIIPLNPSQWSGTVVRISDDEFIASTFGTFGLSGNASIFGRKEDSLLDIFRPRGIELATKCVDDILFI